MQTIEETFSATVEEKKSTFLAYLCPMSSFDALHQKLKNDHDVIYASKGFCFKDPEAKARFGNDNCYTTKPKFSEKEQQRLDAIKARQKELNCK